MTNHIVKVIRLEKLLECEVHAVAPVVARVRRHVDALIMWILATEVAIHSNPILERKHGEHCG